jgi:hypothetical protein
MQRLSKAAYFGGIITCLILSIVLTIGGLVVFFASPASRGRPDAEMLIMLLGVICAGLIPSLVGVIIQLVLLYKLWATIQDPSVPPRTTPGMAVGLLFVPFYNLYWIFQVYWGWTVDFNRLAEARRRDLPRAPEGLALTWCALNLCSGIPLVGGLIALAAVVLFFVFLSQAIDCANALADAKAAGFDYDDRGQDDSGDDYER